MVNGLHSAMKQNVSLKFVLK